MKYMGSKRWMLRNGLGEILKREANKSGRFFDLFSGSGAVSWHVATKTKAKVFSSDLQSFSADLCSSVIERTSTLDAQIIWRLWKGRAINFIEARRRTVAANLKSKESEISKRSVAAVRERCRREDKLLSITRAYGGHYYSHAQSIWLDALRSTLPRKKHHRQATLAALIIAASQCVSSPGHTAQPFQPTKTAKRFIYEGWKKDLPGYVERALSEVCLLHAKKEGAAHVCSADSLAKTIRRGDVVFLDPPYSAVHYSRFYHVLETISRGSVKKVSGIGRYPAIEERPSSDYSIMTKAHGALAVLIELLSKKGAVSVVTFPNKSCSNGLSSRAVRVIGERFYSRIVKKTVRGQFSTLGGDGLNREARQPSSEAIFIFKGPRRIR